MRKSILWLFTVVTVGLGVIGSRGDLLEGLWLLGQLDSVWSPYLFFSTGLICIGLIVDADERIWAWIKRRTAQKHLGRRELKRECQALAREMLAFVIKMQTSDPNRGAWPPFPQGATEEERDTAWQQHTAAITAYYNKLMTEYRQQFGGRVVWLASEIKRRGADDHGLARQGYEHVVNTLQLQAIAQCFAAVGEAL
jgi:hypothetical protein